MRSLGVAAAHCQVLFPGHAHCQVLPPDLPCWLTNPQQSHTQRAGTGALSPQAVSMAKANKRTNKQYKLRCIPVTPPLANVI